MSKKIHSADSNSKETEESIKAYREAAKADAWLFGDYDAYEAYAVSYTHLTLPTIYSV